MLVAGRPIYRMPLTALCTASAEWSGDAPELLEGSWNMKVMSVIGFVLMGGGIVALIVTRTIVSPFLPVIVLQVFAFILMLWARYTFGSRSFHLSADPTEGGLVTTGPFRFVRHPIYTAVCIFVWAAVLGSPSFQTFLFAVVVSIGAVMRIFCEEHLLVQQYPEYTNYARKTKRMIPFVF